jgi:hypothetical protein
MARRELLHFITMEKMKMKDIKVGNLVKWKKYNKEEFLCGMIIGKETRETKLGTRYNILVKNLITNQNFRYVRIINENKQEDSPFIVY